MATNFEKLQKLLEELFQLDQADLDFGIYRIMNQKRDEVVRFLEKDLLPQVREAFGHYKSADKAVLQKELDKPTQQIEAAGMNPDDSPKVQDLKAEMADSSVDVTALENEVFSHLFSFFRRYYHEGDFISLRRYKEGVYAIPYEGEEVKLHWANHDQYYVKSSEYFRDYIFTMPSGKRVRVHLVAASSEQENKKEQAGKERRFIICEEDPIYEENGELFIRFEYRSEDSTKKKQDALNQEAIERVLNAEGFDEWVRELSKPAPTKKNPKRTVLEKHLTQYTARNTFDYFIHKDLGGFLRRELDFYIKNEVMYLDDIEDDSVPRVEQYLRKIKVIRKIAHKVIQFLEQLEDFQKKLWLKKKFVVETNYCITLDRVPEELYPEIAANDAQREEWVRLFAIDEIEKDLNGSGYSDPLTIEFLRQMPGLPVDTAHFNRDFISKLLSETDIATDLSGVLVNSENFQALLTCGATIQSSFQCIYIDPPYNTGKDEFVYKDGYQHSSWMAMLLDRLHLAHWTLSDSGMIMVSSDNNEVDRLIALLDQVFGRNNHISTLIWNTEGHTDNQYEIKENHEYIVVYAKNAGHVEVGFVVDPNTRQESNLWKGFAENSITKNGPGNPPSEVTLPVGFPVAVDEMCLDSNRPEHAFFSVVHHTGFISRSMTQRHGVTYPIRLNNMKASGGRLQEECRVFSGWANLRKLQRFIDNNCEPFEEPDGTLRFYLSERGVIYYRKERDKARNIVSVLRNMGTTEQLRSELEQMDLAFTYPKPKQLLKYLVQIGCEEGAVCDFFAGSGTSAQAVIELQEETEKRRPFTVVEMGSHFDSVLLPRREKLCLTSEWRQHKPLSIRPRSQLLKYIRLESYEDALNNLEMKRSDQQASLLEQDDDLREQYVLSYMLDVESRGSQSLLNVESFCNPDRYKLRIERNGETQLLNVDLVETFNWLLGLTVKHIDVIRGVRVVEGTNPDSDRVLVLWRNLDETDNDDLDEWFKKQDYNTKDQEYDLIYVNGDNNLENLRRGDQTWKVRLIEEEFGRLMFDVEDV